MADIQFKDLKSGEVLFERIFNPSQKLFWKSKARYVLLSGGLGSGKTEPLIIKAIVDAMMYPDNYILMGRKTYQEIYDSLLKEFLIICPRQFIAEERKAPHPTYKLRCPGTNKTSELIFRNLDKMAENEIKGLNLGEIFIDQIEGIPEATFQGLTMRLRRQNCPHKVYATQNPELNWVYQRVKLGKDPSWEIIESPSTENYHNLPLATVEIYENYKKTDPAYYRQYVQAVWDESLLAENTVFAREHISKLEEGIEEPLKTYEGLKIYAEFDGDHRYQMGIDCAEGGGGDNASMTISDLTALEEVANWTGQATPDVAAEKAVNFAELYTRSRYGEESCKIVPEMNSMGLALLQKLKDLGWENIYQREEHDKKSGMKMKKLGWRTTSQTKPLLISNFRHLVRNFPIEVHSRDTLNEMKAFIWTDDAKQKGAGAKEGWHDDRVISLLLSFWENTRRDPSARIIKSEKRPFPFTVAPSFTIVNGKMKMHDIKRSDKNWKIS